MKNLIKNLIIIFLIFILISGIFSLLVDQQKKTSKIPFSDLVSYIKKDKIEKITISGNKIEAILKNKEKVFSNKENESSLTESLKNYGVKPENLQNIKIQIKNKTEWSNWLTIILSTILPFIILGLFFWYTMRQAQKSNIQAFSFTKSRARIASLREKITFNDVAGLKEAKEELKEVVDFLKNPQKFLKIGAKIPRGILLMGAPGTGKTLLAKAVAGEANVPFFFISGAEFVEMFVGVGAARVRDLFQTAKKHAPSIIFIDELDAVGRHRGSGLGGGHDEREQTLNQILIEMDGFDKNTNVIVIAATNRPDILDPALLRPGRFDRRIVLDEPDIKNRKEILKIHLRDKKVSKNINLQKIAERTPGFSGADLANLVNEAAILSAKRNKKIITQKELFESIEKVMLGPERKSNILSKKEKEIAAYHEAGHALVAASLPNTDPVQKISIISRGHAAGYTLKLPTEDKHFHSYSEFLSELSVLLGGYAAEKIIFKDITTGASNDLQKSTELARKLVTKYGMSKLGPITFGKNKELIFLGKEIAEQKNYSEKIAAKIDEEIKEIIDKTYNIAKKIILEKLNTLKKIAEELIKKETLEQKEFEKIIKTYALKPKPMMK